MSTSDPVSVVIPAYNEQDSVANQIRAVHDGLIASGRAFEIIVVDDGSTDQTGDEAVKAGARLLRHPVNKGYGASLKSGVLAARHDTIAIIDADGTYPADEIPQLLEKLLTADMVVGARTGEIVHPSGLRQPARWLLRQMAQRIAEQPIPDLNSGLRVFRRECARQYFSILSNRFSFTTTITLAYLADQYHIVYHPINYYPRTGRSKIVPWHFMDFLILILRMSMMFNPLKIFVPLALFFSGLGVLKTIYDVFSLFARSSAKGWDLLVQPVLSTSALLLLFVGVQFLMIGMVADGVIRRIGQAQRSMAPSYALVNYEDSEEQSDGNS